jgi:hypothetical protein
VSPYQQPDPRFAKSSTRTPLIVSKATGPSHP